MTKPFLSFEDQINKLQNEKGLIINDHLYAEKMLREIGYFGLIGGYKTPFKNPTTKNIKMVLLLRILLLYISSMKIYENYF